MPITWDEFEDRLRASMDLARSFHEKAEDDHAFVAGGEKQWNKEDLAILKEQGRPIITINQVKPVVNAVSGSEVVNRHSAAFRPRTPSLNDVDAAVAQGWAEFYRWVRQTGEMEHEESRMFADTIISGLGFTETFIDYDMDPEGALMTVWVPFWEMSWDPGARAMNLRDARFITRGRWMPLPDFERHFPDAAEAGFVDALASASADSSTISGPVDRSVYPGDLDKGDERGGGRAVYWNRRDQEILVYHHQYYENEDWLRITVPLIDPIVQAGGVALPLPDGNFRRLKPGAKYWIENDDRSVDALLTSVEQFGIVDPVVGLSLRRQSRRIYREAWVSGGEVLEESELPVNRFTYLSTTGYQDQSERDTGGVLWHGLVDDMRDPAALGNKVVSHIVELLSQNPAAMLYEEGAFVDEDEAHQNLNQARKSIKVNPGRLDRIKARLEGNPIPSAAGDLLGFATDAVARVTGVNPFALGNVSDLRRTPAQSITAVQRQAQVILSVLMDSFRLYRKQHAKLVMEYVQAEDPDGAAYIPVDRIARVLPPGSEQVAEAMKDGDISYFDVVVDESPSTPNARAEFWDTFSQFVFPYLQSVGMPPPPSVWDLSPMPVEVAQDFKRVSEMMWQQMMQPQQAAPQPGQTDPNQGRQ